MSGKTVFSDTPPQGTVVTADFLNAVNNHRHTGRNIDGEGALDYATSTGSDNAYSLTLPNALDAQISGMPITFKANFTNTGASTININSWGAVNIIRPDQSALKANDILSGQLVVIMYDGVQYQLINFREIKLIDFAGIVALNGYNKLPDGTIDQWGYFWTGEDGVYDLTFPIAFPVLCCSLVVTTLVELSEHATFSEISKTGAKINTWTTATGVAVGIRSVYYRAIGY
ncbi:MAG: hypothetical protein PHN98_05345 [Smithellaceae bacterium]|nr:hypothetical protein [Smithellaceae bacterium]